jgi:hypothetical protein
MSTAGVGFIGFDGPSATASNQSSPVGTKVPCTMRAVPATCILKVNNVSVANGVMHASGVVTNPAHTVNVPFSNVPLADPTACPILNLVLGPLHLNLLGLVVNLNRVHLNITALPGPGALLGNLLCAVANLLNGSNPVAQNAVLNAVNQILTGL